MSNVTYRHRGGDTVTYSAPHTILERSPLWSRVPEESASYSTLRKAELVALAETRGLDTEGTVADLRARLEADDADPR